VFLRLPIVRWRARHAVTHGPFTRNDHKHTDTGHPLPDVYLQNTCKFAIQSAAWITALTAGAMQKDARVLTHLFPLVLCSTACNIRITKHGIRSVKIPAEQGLGV